MQDSRRYARLKVLIPCAIRVAHVTPSDAWGRIHDLSLGGVEIHTFFQIVKGQTLFLSFQVDERSQFVNAKCTVVRVREDRGYVFVGVSFDDAVDKTHLREAMQSLLDRS